MLWFSCQNLPLSTKFLGCPGHSCRCTPGSRSPAHGWHCKLQTSLCGWLLHSSETAPEKDSESRESGLLLSSHWNPNPWYQINILHWWKIIYLPRIGFTGQNNSYVLNIDNAPSSWYWAAAPFMQSTSHLSQSPTIIFELACFFLSTSSPCVIGMDFW